MDRSRAADSVSAGERRKISKSARGTQINIERALALIDSASTKRVLFIGDSIIDEYVYISPLGKASKENIIAVHAEHREEFAGGISAAACHARSFCHSVDVYSPGPVTRKTRFVEEAYVRKLFEVQNSESSVFSAVGLHLHGYNAVVVTDFGHGSVAASVIQQLTAASETFLAVCAQTNSANFGYNLITKYPRADYIVIDEPEARLAAADRTSPIESIILRLAEGRLSERGKFIVTHGRQGATGYDNGLGQMRKLPAFTDKIVDTMGAGDAFFAVTAPLAQDGDLDDLLLIGNAAGAIKCSITGHRESVTKAAMVAFLNSL